MTLSGFPDAAPLAGLGGGVLIGLAAALMLLGAGRIAGVSGIAARATGLSDSGMSPSSAWMFLLGLPLGALAIVLAKGGVPASFAGPVPLVQPLPSRVPIPTSSPAITSGHGVCGVSRLSQRSLVATATFMAAGIATVAAMNAMGLEVLP